jgi:hypothetical protein
VLFDESPQRARRQPLTPMSLTPMSLYLISRAGPLGRVSREEIDGQRPDNDRIEARRSPGLR